MASALVGAGRTLAARARFALGEARRGANRHLSGLGARLERWALDPAPLVGANLPPQRRDYRVIVPVALPERAPWLVTVGAAAAAARSGEVVLVGVAPADVSGAAGRGLAGGPIPSTDRRPPARTGQASDREGAAADLAQYPALRAGLASARRAGVPAGYVIRRSADVGRAIRREARRQNADVIVMGWRGRPLPGRQDHRLGATLDAVLEDPACDVVVVGGHGDRLPRRMLMPLEPGLDLPAVIQLAKAFVGPQGAVTALRVLDSGANLGQVEAAGHWLDVIAQRGGAPIASRLVVRAASRAAGILDALGRGYDGVIMAAPRETFLDRLLFGEAQLRVAEESGVPVFVVKGRAGPITFLVRRVWARLYQTLPKLSHEERLEVAGAVRESATPRTDFYVMIGLSAIIAAFGLLLDSAAVIIGAMLVAPLMSAIVAVGLGVVEGDLALIRRGASGTLRGSALALALGSAVGLLAFSTQPGAEILSRTRPTLLDLGVALASGAAGAYALSRRGVQASLAGVAIAAALVPPLATAGIGLTMRELPIALGALLLFFTNFVAIAAAAGITFLLLGFGPTADREAERAVLMRGARSGALLMGAVTVILAIVTWRLYADVRLTNRIQRAIVAELVNIPGSELVAVSRSQVSGTMRLDVTIRLPATVMSSLDYRVALQIQDGVAARLRRPVEVVLTIVPTRSLEARPPPPWTPTAVPSPTATLLPTETPTAALSPAATGLPAETPTALTSPAATDVR